MMNQEHKKTDLRCEQPERAKMAGRNIPKIDEKPAGKIPPNKPPNSKFSLEECPFGREFWFFWYRFNRVL